MTHYNPLLGAPNSVLTKWILFSPPLLNFFFYTPLFPLPPPHDSTGFEPFLVLNNVPKLGCRWAALCAFPGGRPRAFRGLEEARGGGCPPVGPGGLCRSSTGLQGTRSPPQASHAADSALPPTPLEFSFHFTCWAVVSECPARHTGHHAASFSQQWKFADEKEEQGKARSESH